MKKIYILILAVILAIRLPAINLVMKDDIIANSTLLAGTRMVNDANSEKVYFFASDRKLYCKDLSTPAAAPACISCSTLYQVYVDAAEYSDLVMASSSQLFYVAKVGTQRKLANYYKDAGGNWQCGILNSGMPDVIAGGAISMDEQGRLFYIGSNGLIYQFSWGTNGWTATALPSQFNLASAYSDLLARGNHVFYISSDNKLCNFYNISGSWGNGVMSAAAPLALAGTSLDMDELDRIWYVASDSKLRLLTWAAGGWTVSLPSNSTVKGSGLNRFTSPRIHRYNNKVYFIDNTSNAISFLFDNGGTWTTVNLYSNNANTLTVYSSGNMNDILLTNNGDILYTDHLNGTMHLLSPIITWNAVMVANNLSVMNQNTLETAETAIYQHKRPFNYQLYPRNASNTGTIPCEGSAYGYMNITFKVEKTDFANNVSASTYTFPVQANGNFAAALNINAELSEYKISYKLNGQNAYTVLADRVLCGDAYMASGQSNMVAAEFTSAEMSSFNTFYGPTSDYGKYSRTYGHTFYYATNEWGIPSLKGAWDGGATSGALILALQYKLQQAYGIPTCIINNAVYGTKIEEHIIDTNNPFYFELFTSGTNKHLAANLLRRAYKSALENNIKGFIWYQGEGNVSTGDLPGAYKSKFHTLYHQLQQFIPALSAPGNITNSKTYLFQVHSLGLGDYVPASPASFYYVAEDQRTMASAFNSSNPAVTNYANIKVIASNGVHYPNCSNIHFNTDGYVELAERLFRVMGSDFYNAPSSASHLAPDIVSVTKSVSQNKVTLTFDQPVFAKAGDNLADILNAVYLHAGSGQSAAVKSAPQVSGNQFSFTVSSLSGITGLSYLGRSFQYKQSPGCSDASNQSGWWATSYLRNTNDIASLSFYNQPLIQVPEITTATGPDENRKNTGFIIYPNPAGNTVHIASSSGLKEIRLFSPEGKLLMTKSIRGEHLFRMDISHLDNGIYTVLITSDENVLTRKLSVIKN